VTELKRLLCYRRSRMDYTTGSLLQHTPGTPSTPVLRNTPYYSRVLKNSGEKEFSEYDTPSTPE
jgi:hypothetical protein